jgi:hypothetical protein
LQFGDFRNFIPELEIILAQPLREIAFLERAIAIIYFWNFSP